MTGSPCLSLSAVACRCKEGSRVRAAVLLCACCPGGPWGVLGCWSRCIYASPMFLTHSKGQCGVTIIASARDGCRSQDVWEARDELLTAAITFLARSFLPVGLVNGNINHHASSYTSHWRAGGTTSSDRLFKRILSCWRVDSLSPLTLPSSTPSRWSATNILPT